MIRIDFAERFHRGAVSGLEDKQASQRFFTIIFDKGSCRNNLDPFGRRSVKVGAMVAIMLGTGLQPVFLIKRVDHEEHSLPLRNRLAAPS